MQENSAPKVKKWLNSPFDEISMGESRRNRILVWEEDGSFSRAWSDSGAGAQFPLEIAASAPEAIRLASAGGWIAAIVSSDVVSRNAPTGLAAEIGANGDFEASGDFDWGDRSEDVFASAASSAAVWPRASASSRSANEIRKHPIAQA